MNSFVPLRDALGLAPEPGDDGLVFAKVENDSRRVTPGDLFVAIQGSCADGGAFIADAISRGAALVLREGGDESAAAPVRGVPVRRVADGYLAYAEACRLASGSPDRELRLVGVTGTNGKTTTAFLVQRLLEAAGLPCGLISTVEYRDGGQVCEADRTTPEAGRLFALFARMRSNALAAVSMELSSHALAQRRCGKAEFAATIFTNLTGDHLDYHKTMEAYYECKRRLFFENTAPEGMRFVHVGDEWGAQLVRELRAARLKVTSFGVAPDCDVRIEDPEYSGDGCAFTLLGTRYRSNLAGSYNASNLAGAVLASAYLGAAPECMAETLARGIRVPGRLECIALPGGRRCYVDYAHTDDALEKVLTALRPLVRPPGRLAVVFGCGGDRDCTKRPRMGRAALQLADRVIVTSDNPRSEDPSAIISEIVGEHAPACEIEPDRARAIDLAVRTMNPCDVTVVAGKGHEKTQTIGSSVIPFDDVAHVRASAARCYGPEAGWERRT